MTEHQARPASQPSGRCLGSEGLARVTSDGVPQTGRALMARTVGAAEETAIGLDPVPHDLDAAVFADRRQAVDCALEAVEDVDSPSSMHLETHPVVVAADLTNRHVPPPTQRC